jgi:hypothetical protein
MRTHTREKPFECSDCSYRAASAGQVRRHFASVHKTSASIPQASSLHVTSLVDSDSSDSDVECDDVSATAPAETAAATSIKKRKTEHSM